MSESSPKFIDPSRQYRAAHRARMHAEAHSQDQGSAPILQHPLVSQQPPELIQNDAELGELLQHLHAAGSFAYDSEFIGELTYVPKLCLVQVATTRRVALIDPLAPVNLMLFWELICDGSVAKIVHAGEQDIEPVVRLTGRGPANLIDTQVMAAFGGLAYPASLQKLVQTALNFKLGKGLTFTHWDQRPLSAMQLRYAADDVRYLPALAEELNQRAAAAGNLEIARQECAARCDPVQFDNDAAGYFAKIRGASNLSRTQLAVLRELCLWRDAAAQSEDIPTRALMRDDLMIGLVRTPLREQKDVENVRGMPRPVAKRFATQIIAAVQKGHDLPAEHRPMISSHEEGPRERFEIDRLWARVQCACYDRQIDAAVLGSRQLIARLYQSPNDANFPNGWKAEIIRGVLKQ